MLSENLTPPLEVIATIGLPLIGILMGIRVVIQRRRDTWTPLRQQPSPFGPGLRRFLVVAALIFAAAGVIPTVDGLRSHDAWMIAVGVVRLCWFSTFAWVIFEIGRDDGLDELLEDVEDPPTSA